MQRPTLQVGVSLPLDHPRCLDTRRSWRCLLFLLTKPKLLHSLPLTPGGQGFPLREPKTRRKTTFPSSRGSGLGRQLSLWLPTMANASTRLWVQVFHIPPCTQGAFPPTNRSAPVAQHPSSGEKPPRRQGKLKAVVNMWASR